MYKKIMIAALLIGFVAGTVLAQDVVWRRDWKSAGITSDVGNTALDGGPRAGSPEVGNQDFTAVAQIRLWDPAGVGGYGMIGPGGSDLYEARVEITDVQYQAGSELTLDFVIGTGSSTARAGTWFVEFGTFSGANFTALPGAPRYDLAATVEEDENLMDNTNPSDLFGYNVGGRLQQLVVTPPASVIGRNVAFRFGITSSANFAGFSDMALTLVGPGKSLDLIVIEK